MNFSLFMVLIGLLSGCSSMHLTWQEKIDRAAKHYSPAAEARLKPYFRQKGADYPPEAVTLLAFKKERRLELWVREEGQPHWIYIKTYPILAASGRLGPKLRKGDYQVPEGVYQVVGFNPESRFHLSLLLDYPNAFDQQQARFDGRRYLGDDIFIHGGHLSIGCLAMGDRAIEELFVLVYRVGLSQVKVIIAPKDMRQVQAMSTKGKVSWLPTLYNTIQKELIAYSTSATGQQDKLKNKTKGENEKI